MKQGTVSVLFGCHCIIHSVMVVVAWKKHYGSLPAWWQLACIFLHDIGHWGKNYLDDYEQKKKHWQLGAKIAGVLFGQKGFDLVAGHTSQSGITESILRYPDKYSWVIAPDWWLVSNTIFEPKLIRNGCTRKQSAVMWREAMTENMATGFATEAHRIYLEQFKATK